MRYLSVCSGIEAASVAWHGLGWQPAAFSEIEAFPRKVLAHRFPEVPLHGDFTTIQPGQYGPVRLLVGGTPCQAFSVAGLRQGLRDARGNLALEFLALAQRERPEWILWENVPGVLSSNGGRDFGSFLGGLVELGYGFAYRVLDAQHAGVPQRRRRVFVVGRLGDWRRAAAVLFESASLRWDPPPRRQAREDAAGGSALSVALRGREGGGTAELGDDQAGCLRASTGGGDKPHVLQVATTLRARDTSRGVDSDCTDTLVVGTLGRSHGNVRADEAWTGRLMPVAFSPSASGKQTSLGASEDASPTLKCTTPAAVAFAENSRAEVRLEGGDGSQVGALSTGGGKPGQGMPCIASDGVRRLTPLECERLQGFPDGWTAIPGAADGPRYKAIGNSMAVPVMRWIGERIALVDALEAA